MVEVGAVSGAFKGIVWCGVFCKGMITSLMQTYPGINLKVILINFIGQLITVKP
jgi:uncharacterized membrane protein